MPAITHDSRAVARRGDVRLPARRPPRRALVRPGAVAAGASSLLVDHRLRASPTSATSPSSSSTTPGWRWVRSPRRSTATRRRRCASSASPGPTARRRRACSLAAILRAAGDPTSVIGTLSGAYTTPEAPELQARLAELRDQGDRSVVMEVSSHALALHRVDGTRFDAAVFTNLGRDHLDLHGTVEEYFRAKALLFQPGRAVVGVVNVDDPHGRRLFDAAPIEMVPFSSRRRVRRRGHRRRRSPSPGAASASSVPLGGAFNVMNALAAATTAAAIGIGIEAIVAGLGAVGRRPRPVRAGHRRRPARRWRSTSSSTSPTPRRPRGGDRRRRCAGRRSRPGDRRVRRRRRPRPPEAAGDGGDGGTPRRPRRGHVRQPTLGGPRRHRRRDPRRHLRRRPLARRGRDRPGGGDPHGDHDGRAGRHRDHRRQGPRDDPDDRRRRDPVRRSRGRPRRPRRGRRRATAAAPEYRDDRRDDRRHRRPGSCRCSPRGR